MILENLNELGNQIQEKIKNYDNKELILSDEFKNEFKSFLLLNSKDNIEFQKYTTIVTTSKELKIIFPNQWFYIASFFYDFLNSLWKYKGIANELNLSDEIIKDLRKNVINEELKSKIQLKINDNNDFTFFELFLTNYDWWFGSKTIDRGDFFVSSVLNLSKVVNVSHSYLADLAYYFSKNESLKNLISKDYENLINLNNSNTKKTLLEEKKLRIILNNTFKYILKIYGEEKVLKGYEIKDAKIENRKYKGITIPKYFGFEVLIGMFDEVQNNETLKSSGTLRFIDDEFSIIKNPHSYFTSQWNESNDRGLSLANFNNLLNDISESNLEIINDNDIFKLIQKSNLNSVSPLNKTEQKIYYGAPGTGKSYKVDNEIKNLNSTFYERITFHPEFDNSSFVGGYRPVSLEVNYSNAVDGNFTEHEVHYKYVPQAFTNIYVRAWNDLDNQYYLAIEEINRGNCAEIFGDIFQLLDRNSNYTVSPSNELKQHLHSALTNKDGIKNGLKLPPNLSILATMNTSDQSLFPMDSAFKRRWDWEYIPICYDNIPENESFNYIVNIDESTSFKWIDFIKNANAIIKANPNLGMDKCIGNYFIKSGSNEISLNEFVNKAIFYLWNDVFKDEDSSDSIFEKGTSYEDFFPINSNGKDLINKIIEKLKIEISPKDN
ncbi:AAA family ATPase [Flavobacterium terrigena]|uniref:AAA domain (Dynein-related subfamily) n=1 Tax=Flavobacterium terrigena TaxID=402734 RepID=A0A1H6Y0Y6_9FLAO|nr:AAA family ATPase [Flavobacterium terrigena]SEJ34963.1 AAA domain (dynein-related subfamily) [Flavobacterium terrigena]